MNGAIAIASNQQGLRDSKLEKIRTVLEKHQDRLDEKNSELQNALKQARRLRLKQNIMSEEQKDNEGEILAKPKISDETLESVAVETVEKSSDDYNAKIGRTKIEREEGKESPSNENPAAALQKWQNPKKTFERLSRQGRGRPRQDHYDSLPHSGRV